MNQFLPYSLGMSTTQAAALSPFYIHLYSFVSEEFYDVFLDAESEEEAGEKAIAYLAKYNPEIHKESFEVLKTKCTA